MGAFSLFNHNNIEKETFSDMQLGKNENLTTCLQSSSQMPKELFEIEGKNKSLSGLNEEQKKAVSFDGKHLLVLAGAGTGKTKTIVARALYLLEHGISPSKILILSFTRKSANVFITIEQPKLIRNIRV